MTAASGKSTARLFTSPRVRVLNALNTNPKSARRLRPNLSVSAPPITLPTRLNAENIPRMIPAWVMPTLNRWVMYRAKNGKSRVPPIPSMKEVEYNHPEAGGEIVKGFI